MRGAGLRFGCLILIVTSPTENHLTADERGEILNAVAAEEHYLCHYYGHMLYPDQIRGKALKKLGVPSKVGGRVDWSKIT